MRVRTVVGGALAAALLLAAALASWTPQPGQDQLRWAPVTIGLPFIALWAVTEVLWRASRSRTAKALATLALSGAALLVLLRLRLAFLTPAAARDDSWQLWTIFTAVNMAVVAIPLVVLGAVMEGITRLAGREPKQTR